MALEPKCRSCGEPIEWATTRNGKPMPLDPGEFENGNLVVDAVGIVRARTDDDDRLLRPKRRSHFASCKQADMWRRT